MENEDAMSWAYSKSAEDFGTWTDADDFIHPTGNPDGASVTETYYYTFSIPEESIHSFIYVWLHPNLKVLSGGVHIYQGRKSHYLAAEYYNWLDYLDTSHINADNGSISLPNGFTMKINSPFKEHELLFEDKGEGVSFRLVLSAAMNPVVRAGGNHFEQNMRAEGELRLRGKTYNVDCFTLRDRSWGEHRSEMPMSIPPFTWVTVQDANFAFCAQAVDDMRQYPGYGDGIKMPGKLFMNGWVEDQGKLSPVVTYGRKTIRDDELVPLSHDIDVTDKLGRQYSIKGVTRASCPVQGWKNSIMRQCMMQWNVNGRTIWGESQDVQWNNFIRQYGRK